MILHERLNILINKHSHFSVYFFKEIFQPSERKSFRHAWYIKICNYEYILMC